MWTTRGITVALALLAIGGQASAGTVSELLEEAVFTEETVGDLEGAIAVYEQIIEEDKASRACVAQAQYRLGMCHLKLGREKEALAALEGAVKKFPEQTELVKAAKDELGSLVATQTFPEFEGCRLKEAIEVALKVSGTDPPSRGEVHACQGSLLEIVIAECANAEDYVTYSVHLDSLSDDQHYSVEYGPEKGVGAAPYTVGGFPDSTPRPGRFTLTVQAKIQEAGGGAPTLKSARTLLLLDALPRTQIMINDIQPDGTVRFTCIDQHVNGATAPFTGGTFINSDLVELEDMFDADGEPVTFSTEHEGNKFRYEYTLNKPVLPGEPVFLGNEGTITGLVTRVDKSDNEFRYEMTHTPGYGAEVRRIETFTLPEGAELIETTPAYMARRQKDGRTELYVEKMVPARGSIHTAFRYRLTDAALASEQLKLEPAPWKNGETMRLRLATQTGMELGTLIYSAQEVEAKGKRLWRIEAYQTVPMAGNDGNQFTRVDAEIDSFAPVYGRTKNFMGDFVAHYDSEAVILMSDVGGEASTRTIPLQAAAYDNEQALYLIRRMPLADGYEGSFPIFPVTSGAFVECRIKVLSREMVEAPLGSFDCYKVDLTVWAGGIRALQHTLWFSTDGNRYLVKYDAGTAIMELVEAGVRAPGTAPTFTDDDLGFSMVAPTGWHIYKAPGFGGYDMAVFLYPPEMRARCTVRARRDKADVQTLSEFVQAEIERVAGCTKDYIVRENSMAEGQIASVPAVSYIADYQEKGKAMVEYRTYLSADTAVFWFVFRVEADSFDNMRSQFDAVVASAKLK